MECKWPGGCTRIPTGRTRMTRGMCHYHYKQGLEDGSVTKLEPLSPQDRFEKHFTRSGGFADFSDPYIRVTPEDGECWIWTSKTQSQGYGRFKLDGRLQMAHRVSLRLFKGVQVPDELDVDHLCRRTLCVNPDHLEAVTRRENTLRGRTLQVNRESRKPFCQSGHPMTEDNVITYKNNRRCRTCHNILNREWMRAYRARSKNDDH